MKANKLGFAGAIALSGLLAFASASIAQTNTAATNAPPARGGRGGGRGGMNMTPDERLKQMTEQLTLTTEQQAKIKPILEDYQKKVTAIPQDDADRRGKMTSARDDATEKINAILTADQKTKWETAGGLRGGRGGRRGGQGGPPPGQ
jgi:Spy/CpxP family protein refolding chaperone